MRFTLSITESVQDNANEFFERSKKLKRKVEGAKLSIVRLQKQLDEVDKKRDGLLAEHREKQEKKNQPKRPLQWFEKFRWFRSSEGFLCIGGRDASTNDVLIRKHTDKGDLVFHTEAPGSPFFVIKAEGKEVGQATIKETAQAAATFSRAWKMGLSAVDAYYVNPDQLSKEAPTGEYISKGAWMVRGKRTNLTAKLSLAVGILDDGLVMGGPVEAVKHSCKKSATVVLGDDKPSDVAKKIAKFIGAEIDDVLRVLPAGNMKVVA